MVKAWTVTPWQTDANGRWIGIAPVILVEGELPFTADTPAAYVQHLKALHGRADVARGPFWSRIGEFLDEVERVKQ